MTTKLKPFLLDAKGKNEHSLKTQFSDRAYYSIAHPYIYDESFPTPINFWTDANAFYGRMDENRDLILPIDRKTKQISDLGSSNVYALNFVTDAFEDFIKFLKIKKSNKLLADDNFTTDWTAKRGYSSFNTYYNEYLQQIMDSFTSDYLQQSGKHGQVQDFDSFLKIFMTDYVMEIVEEYPVTKTGMTYSRFYNPMFSGLCVEISTADHGDDEWKFRNFINNYNFKLYSLAASKFGFLIDKNAPWRLVANLNSAQMKSYINNYLQIINMSGFTEPSVGGHFHEYSVDEEGNGETTSFIESINPDVVVPEHTHKIVEGVMETYNAGVINHAHLVPSKMAKDFTAQDVYRAFFRKTILSDLQDLRSTLVVAYNDYVRDYRTVTIAETCAKSREQRTLLRSKNRKQITFEQVAEKYSDIFWLKSLFKIRLKELKANIDDTSLNYNLKKLAILNKTVDFSAALNYSERYLKQFY